MLSSLYYHHLLFLFQYIPEAVVRILYVCKRFSTNTIPAPRLTRNKIQFVHAEKQRLVLDTGETSSVTRMPNQRLALHTSYRLPTFFLIYLKQKTLWFRRLLITDPLILRELTVVITEEMAPQT